MNEAQLDELRIDIEDLKIIKFIREILENHLVQRY